MLTPRLTSERQLAFFGAFCLFLSTLEVLVPKPLPFLRVGLANLPVLLSLSLYPARFTLALVALKIAGQALVGGTLFSYVFLFSAAGSLASAGVMLGLRGLLRKKMMSLAGLGIAGSLASNITQVFFARLLILGEGAWLIAPPFLFLGTVSGLLVGVFAEAMRKNSAWLASIEGNERNPGGFGVEEEVRAVRPEACEAFFCALCGFFAAIPFLLAAAPEAKVILAGFFMAGAAASGRRIRVLPNLVLAATVTAVHLVSPFGKVLCTLAGHPVTEGALRAGLSRSAAVIGLVYLSRFAVRPSLRLPGRPGRIFSAMLRDFERITGSGVTITRRDFWACLDRLLGAVYASGDEGVPATGGKRGFFRYAAGLAAVAASWAVFAVLG